ncbi:MAG TPA: glutathione S-transferase family protein [Burkholderiales bacterium]|nr:glutathione S-transferase family protein [Burkholderiales bacterium]
MATPRIILHHFEKSPFSEKVRVVFGIKQIAWSSVLIPRIMPRPDLMPMTGGYRRTPTMQIGADIFCDTQIILRELERRFPVPTLLPGSNAGLGWMLGMWSDRSFFQNTVNLVFGTLADQVPKEFREDREQLRGQQFDVQAMKAAIPQMRDQLRAHVDWIEAQLNDGRTWLLGNAPSLADVDAYMNVWYVRGNLPDAVRLFEAFPNMLAWEQRVKNIGHGLRGPELTSAEALQIARDASPQTASAPDLGDLNGRKPGDRVQVTPDDYGKIPVEGTIVSLSAQHIAIRRNDELAGEVVVHFPRAGFLVTPLG